MTTRTSKKRNINNTVPVTHFEAQPLSAEFKEADGHIQTSALILVEGEHIDSKQRKHIFSADRIQKIADNTNRLLQMGTRVPFLADHIKAQDKTYGDLDGSIETRVITPEDIGDSRYNHLVGKFGAFANQITIKSRQAIEQYRDKLLSTISPGIDIVSDCIREISATSTPAIVGLRLFKGHDTGLATFALSFDELENSDDQVDQVKQQYDELTEDLWLVLASILTATDEALNGQDQSQLMEKALDDFETRLLEVLGVQPEDEESEQQPTTPVQEDIKAQQSAGMPRTLSQRGSTAQYESSQVLAAFTLDEMEKLAEFGIGSAFKTARTALGGVAKKVATEASKTKNMSKLGFGISKAKASLSGKGRLKSNLAGIGGAAKAAYGTTGGKIAAGGLGVAAVGGTAMGVNKLRKPKKPKF